MLTAMKKHWIRSNNCMFCNKQADENSRKYNLTSSSILHDPLRPLHCCFKQLNELVMKLEIGV